MDIRVGSLTTYGFSLGKAQGAGGGRGMGVQVLMETMCSKSEGLSINPGDLMASLFTFEPQFPLL